MVTVKTSYMKKALLPPMKIVRFPVLTIVHSEEKEPESNDERQNDGGNAVKKYPPILMPEQPKKYIKARDYDFF